MRNQISNVLLFATIAAFQPACTSVPDRNSTPLPIETVGVDARESKFRGRLYVTGSVRKRTGQALPPAAHVEVQIVDATGKVLASRRDDIDAPHPRLSRARSGRTTFVVSFPASEVETAAGIRVVYHAGLHSRS